MYKALITDLDGTAIAVSSNGDDIDAATKDLVQAAIKNGKKLTCATGKEWEITKDVVTKLGFVSPCIIEGGTRIIDPKTEETIWEKALDTDAPAKVLAIFKSESTNGLIMHSSDTSRQKLSQVGSLPSSLRFVYLLAVSEEIAIKISNRINAEHYAVAHFTPSWKGDGFADLHVTHPKLPKNTQFKYDNGWRA